VSGGAAYTQVERARERQANICRPLRNRRREAKRIVLKQVASRRGVHAQEGLRRRCDVDLWLGVAELKLIPGFDLELDRIGSGLRQSLISPRQEVRDNDQMQQLRFHVVE